MWTFQTLCVLVITKMVTSQSSTLFLKQPGSYVQDFKDEVFNLTDDSSLGITYKCMEKCFDKMDCRSGSCSEREAMCKLHMVSPWGLNFTGNISTNSDWLFFTRDAENIPEWKPIAKFSSSSGTFEGDLSYEMWNTPKMSVNNVSCAGNLSAGCSRHFVHHAKDWLLAKRSGTKIKISFYEGDVETAWAIFDQQPGSNDNWFHPSRVLDSYPWDTQLLKSSSEMGLQPQKYNNAVRFYILESNPALHLRQESGHPYWMKIVDRKSSECEYGRSVNYPYILYSKGTGPTLLSKSAVAHVVKWRYPTGGRYTLPWSEAQTFCENNLYVPIATYDEVNSARMNQPYQCCNRGWMANQIYSHPMVVNGGSGCGGPGMVGRGTSGSHNVYCKPDQSLVGVADTVVISINI